MKKMIIVLSVALCSASHVYGADAVPSGKLRVGKEAKKSETVKKRSKKPKAATFGNCTINTIYNNAHHRVFLNTVGRNFFIPCNTSREVAALFKLTERKEPKNITLGEIEKDLCKLHKGDYTYVLRLTPDGLTVHRVGDDGKARKGRQLLPVDTQDVVKDLEVVHVATGSKTAAFKLHDVDALLKEKEERAAGPKRTSFSSMLRKNSDSSSVQSDAKVKK